MAYNGRKKPRVPQEPEWAKTDPHVALCRAEKARKRERTARVIEDAKRDMETPFALWPPDISASDPRASAKAKARADAARKRAHAATRAKNAAKKQAAKPAKPKGRKR